MSESILLKKYLEKIARSGEDVLTRKETNQLVQQYAISYYRDRVVLKEGQTCTVLELAKVLAQLEITFQLESTQVFA